MEINPQYRSDYGQALLWVAEEFKCIGRKPLRDQGRETPYVMHLLAVSAFVWEDGGDETQAIAALLHDAVEDLPHVTLEFISCAFGEAVGRIVGLCSDTQDTTNKAPWRRRKIAHLARMRRDLDPKAARVIAADKLHNLESLVLDHAALRAMASSTPKDFKGGFGGTLWYDEQMHALLSTLLEGSVLIERLGRAIEVLRAAHQPDEERVARIEVALRGDRSFVELATDGPSTLEWGGFRPDAVELSRRVGDGEPLDGVATELLERWYGPDPAAAAIIALERAGLIAR